MHRFKPLVSTFDRPNDRPTRHERRVLVRSAALMANTRHISDCFDPVRPRASDRICT